MNVFLEIKNIKKHFGEGESRVEVLKGIDIEIEKGEFCVLLGPSGSGLRYAPTSIFSLIFRLGIRLYIWKI